MDGFLRSTEEGVGAPSMMEIIMITQEQFDSLPEPVQQRWINEVNAHRAPSRDLIEITQWCLTDYVPVPPGISCRWKQ